MKERLLSVFYMFILSLGFTTVVSGVHLWTEDRIRINQELKIQRVVLEALDLLPSSPVSDRDIVATYRRRIREATLGDRPLYVAWDDAGRNLLGYAFPISGAGFWGPIHGILAVDPSVQKVKGIVFYQHQETPGLGGRITEAWFQNQFKGRPLIVPPRGMRFFYLKTPGTAQAPTEVDTITGATETSRRLEAFLDTELKRTIPLLMQMKKRGAF